MGRPDGAEGAPDGRQRTSTALKEERKEQSFHLSLIFHILSRIQKITSGF